MKIGALAWLLLAAVVYVTVKGRAPVYSALVSSQSNGGKTAGASTIADPTTAASKTGLPGSTANPFYSAFENSLNNFTGVLH